MNEISPENCDVLKLRKVKKITGGQLMVGIKRIAPAYRQLYIGGPSGVQLNKINYRIIYECSHHSLHTFENNDYFAIHLQIANNYNLLLLLSLFAGN